MKKLFLLFLLSCTKAEQPPAPVQGKAVTFERHFYSFGKYVGKDTSIHWCEITGQLLAQYEAIQKRDYFVCGSTPEDSIRLILIISDRCPNKLNHQTASQ